MLFKIPCCASPSGQPYLERAASAPESHSFWGTQVGELEKHWCIYLLAHLEPGCSPLLPSGIQKPPGGGNVTGTDPDLSEPTLPPATATRPFSEGTREATARREIRIHRPVWGGWYRAPGRLLPGLISSLCKLKAQHNFKESERDKKPNKVGPKASWNYVVFCPVAGDPVTDACDYGLCKQLSEKFIRCPKAAEEQMCN